MTPQLTWATEQVPEPERVSQWGAAASETWVPVDVRALGSEPFSGRVTARRVGALGVATIRSGAQTVHRGDAQIAARSGDAFFLNMPLTEGAVARQDGRTAHLAPGDFVVVDGARPFELAFTKTFAQVSLTLPHELLGSQLAQDGSANAVRVAGDRGVGAVATGALRALARDTGSLDLHTARALAEELAGLVRLALGAAWRPARAGSRALLLDAAREEIHRSLGDPRLSPESIAERLSVSVRYLHRLFSDDGMSFSRWVLEQRLQQCRRELIAAGPEARSVGAVAAAAGFTDASYFARVFKTRFGVTPSQARLAA